MTVMGNRGHAATTSRVSAVRPDATDSRLSSIELSRIRWKNTCRLIPSRYPTRGILDEVASPEDLPSIFELESWTNDRISAELGVLHKIPQTEWVTGPQATVIMAAFCHPRAEGGRFNGPERGAWYAARSLATAHAEVIYHRSRELAEIGVFNTRMEMRLYLSDFNSHFHDVRDVPQDPDSYKASQKLAADHGRQYADRGKPDVPGNRSRFSRAIQCCAYWPVQ